MARGRDSHHRRGVAEGAPEEPRLARLLPAGLIDAEHRRGPNRIAKPLLRLAQSGAGAPNDRIDATDGDLHPEELATEVCRLAAREPKASGEGGDRTVQARTEALAGNLGRQLSPGERAAVGTAAASEAVLSDPDRDLGQLGDLVTGDRPPRRPIGERALAAPAALGQILDHLIHPLDPNQPTARARVAGLTPGLAIRALALALTALARTGISRR